MAMNKKEQAAFDALQEQANINRALRWSDYSEERDVPVPAVGKYANGWSFNAHNATVYPTWSNSVVHGSRKEGEAVDENSRREQHISASQNGIRQFSTKKRALKALRRALERKFAEQLALIDSRLAAENNGPV